MYLYICVYVYLSYILICIREASGRGGRTIW